MLDLYEYQRETVDNVVGESMFGSPDILVTSPISSGKSLQIVTVAMNVDGKVLISLSISDLVDQFVDTFTEQGFDDFTVLKAGHDISFDDSKRVIIGMDNTCFSRLHLLPRNISMLISDEIHIRYKGDRYRAILDHLSPECHVGFTGTPFSSRGTKLDGFSTEFVSTDINTLISEGKLAKPKYLVPRWTLDESYSPGSKIGSEFTNDDMAAQQTPEYIRRVVDNYMNNEHFNGMESKSIWFCSSVEMAKDYEEELQSRGYPAMAYHGKMKKNIEKTVMHSFKENEKVLLDKDIHLFNYRDANEPVTIRGLISINKLAIGFSVSDIDVGVRTSSTSILSRHYQIDGRAIRSNPGKEFGHILDCGQNVLRLGLITDKYEPLPYDSDIKDVRQSMKQITMPHLHLISGDIIDVTRSKYDDAVQKILSDPRRYSDMPSSDLSKLFSVETDISSLIGIGMAFMLVVHCEPMDDKWGNPSMGYMAESYDKNKNKKVFKPVVGFYSGKTLNWMSSEAIDLFDRYSSNKYLIDKWTKSFKTKIRSIVNGKKSIYSIKFFASWLEDNHLESESKQEFADNISPEDIPF